MHAKLDQNDCQMTRAGVVIVVQVQAVPGRFKRGLGLDGKFHSWLVPTAEQTEPFVADVDLLAHPGVVLVLASRKDCCRAPFKFS